MSKIDEILNKYRDITRWPEYPEIMESEYIQAMKEYAELYALEYRSKILDECWTDDYYGLTLISEIELCTIKLPDHE